MGCGTTSACAENTPKRLTLGVVDGNYLRVRGEYYLAVLLLLVVLELPPRARRIRFVRVVFFQQLGTTSACAENTKWHGGEHFFHRNYLRVRGEYSGGELAPEAVLELPPRARRIPGAKGIYASPPGTTSACAENTSVIRATLYTRRNYLRVRGEYAVLKIGAPYGEELPPRARRIR